MLVEEWRDNPARSPTRDLGDNRPTRGRKSGSGARFAVDAQNEHEKAEESFVATLASFLNTSALNGKYDQLVVAATPSALGILRKQLSSDTIAKQTAVFDKDLTNMPEKELREYFQDNIERW